MANKFVSALKKVGQIVLEGAQIFMGIQPLIQSVDPKLAANSDFQVIGGIITDVESIGAVLGNPGLTGAQKLAAASALVSQYIATQFASKKIENPALFQQASTEITQGFVDLYNSFDQSAVETQDIKSNGALPPISVTPVPVPPAS